MKRINRTLIGSLLTTVFLAVALLKVSGQTSMPDVLLKDPLKDQLNYLEEKTRIYENYRAIREDMFQRVKLNITDTLTSDYNRINQLGRTAALLNRRIDSLGTELAATKTRLEEMTSTKNSISLLGIEVDKLIYNSIMWLIILGLAIVLAIGFMLFKRNMVFARNTKTEMDDLKEEFQAYRKSSREAREKMSMDHFNEMKRLKGG
jgi:uncharacterized membrane-anchored protein YhcB (DUF1043 family)